LLKSLAEARYAQRAPLGPAREGLGTLGEWNRQLISYGARIFTQRALLLAELEPLLTAVHHNLSGARARFEVGYVPGLAARHYSGAIGPAELAAHNWSAAFESALEAGHEADLRRGTTLAGPHRDDLVFSLDGVDLRRYGSQGQQRLAVLALKIALARWIAATLEEAPVLLLDDALSELDAERRGRLLAETAPFAQCVLTATDASFVGKSAATVMAVSGGHIVS
jgi:DNA replication and repair protein RecF